ncbi:hypothetical protein CUR178_04942 [Leishmania enriettii]|uniref:Uncharacterized protein n=1 Tax=Leishmania enriettii TaxID=5663 RepID=A0A836GA95_LEIEN|nr:hypothetical protein CUR178_04942 [Leishmania enriettii]
MFGTTSSSTSPPLWRHHVQDHENSLVRELMEASDVDAVLARMENDHYRHLSPIMRKLTSYDAAASAPQQLTPHYPSTAAAGPTSPRAGAPPPPPPPPEPSVSRTYGGGFDGSVDWDAQSSPSILQPAYSCAPRSCRATSPASNPYHIGLRDGYSTTRASPTARPPPPPPPPPLQTPSSSMYGAVAHDPLDAYRRPADGAAAASSRLDHREAESRYQPTIDSWLWPDDQVRARRTARGEERPLSGSCVDPSAASQQVHADPALNLNAAENGLQSPPTPRSPCPPSAGRLHGSPGARLPRVTTRMASVSPLLSSASRLGASAGDLHGLESTSQSRIARQLQLLRNYRQLAELCSCTDSPRTDLFRSLPSEELARIQLEQLKGLAQREQSPITVNNNYYFDSGSGDRHGNSRRGSGIDGKRLRGDNSDPLGAGHDKPNTGTAPGNSRSASEALSAESHPQAAASRRPSGTSWLQRQRPSLLPLQRTVPLQSPQPSSGPDSPVATPPLSLRGGNLAPPSPSRSQRGRSHCNRLLDVHYTPTATTEEAGSSYAEDDEEADYAGDCMDNSGSEDDEDYDVNGAGYRRPPPRIIEREQHRRFPAANIGDDAFPSSTAGHTAQPPLVPTASQVMHERQSSYSGDYANNQTLTNINEHSHNASSSTPHGMRSGSAAFAPGGARSSVGGVPGSDGGRRSVSSAINVLAGEQELRNNAQWQSGGGRGAHEHRRTSQHLAETLPYSHQQMRNVSTPSSFTAQLGGDALTDPGASPEYLPLHDPRQGNREREGSVQGSPMSASRREGNTESCTRMSPTVEQRPIGESGTRRASASVPQCDRRRRERDNRGGTPRSHRKDATRRGWGQRGADSGDGSDVGSVRSGICGSDSDDSACDTPGNPQLQTHRPRSSLQKKEQTSHRRNGCSDRFGEEVRALRRKDRVDRKQSSAKERARQEQRSRRAEGGSTGGGGARRYVNDRDAIGSVRSSASYSCSYTSSSDISDYVPGSYYSPIGTGHLRGSPRGTRGSKGTPGRRSRAGRGGRGGTFQALYGSRGRDGAMLGSHYVSAPAAGAGSERRQILGSHGRRPAVAREGVPEGLPGPHRGRGRGLYPQLVASQQQQPQRGGFRPPVGVGARGPSVGMVGGSAGLANGMIHLPDGRVIPATSPEARWYQQAMRMMAAGAPGMHTRAPMTTQQVIGHNPSAGVYQSGLPYAAGPGGMPSALTPSPIKGGRAASPSAAGNNGPHIQPGLLYGSLLPKARPETALMVVEDEHGRSRSVDPHSNASRTLLLERGSVCPVQAATSNSDSQVDVFPIVGGAINGSTNAGVLPLEWKSGGSGCVVGRSGHVPVAPRNKLSSHYATPGSKKGLKYPQQLPSKHLQQQPRRATVIAASSPAASALHLPSNAPTASAASFTQKPQQQQQGYHSLHTADAGQRNSLFSHHSSLGGANAQQRYVPLQAPLQGAMHGHRESVLQQQQNPHGLSSRTAAARNANLQRFGIAPLQG